MQAVRRMDIGERLILPVSQWNAARSAACVVARTYGSRFHVHRHPFMGPEIHVERLA